MSNNSTDDYDYDEMPYLCDDMDFSTVNAAFFIVIFIISVTGNSLLLVVLVCYENLKNATNLFVLNLACSDLVFTVTLPFWAVGHLHHWVFGDLACKLLTAAYFVGLYSSVILLTAITVDRFITVVLNKWPRKPVRERCAVGVCAAAWIISFAASLSDAINVKEFANGEELSCESDDLELNLNYYLQVSLLFLLPLAIIIFCYSAILITVLQFSNRKRRRTVVVVLCIVAAFFVCWGPHHVLLFVETLYEPEGCDAEKSWDIAYHTCRILAYSHCCMNPLLYMLSQNLRRHLLKFLHCDNGMSRSMERVTSHSGIRPRTSEVMVDLQSK
ncbi:chemokine XC receptor 1-like [Scomber japonicus]|uniref:chemokine XC receptor 1-like n=1 Tax=Scomber japonicus TaxID=13676 RepID=UPI00230670B3|nr:chemokine XC receptor 1-like [Scomber japonicus]